MEATAHPMRWLAALALATAAIALLGLATVGLLGSAAEAEPKAQASKAKITIKIREFAFRRPTALVTRGTTIVFANKERSVSHTATANGGSFDTGTIQPGKAVAVSFRKKGTFRFHCEIHPEMRGKVVVQ